MEKIPLSLYIHWPWCLKKCPYCDFNSHGIKGSVPEEKYTQAILNSLREQALLSEGRKLRSIFFGGGTPSLMSPESIERILTAAEELIGFQDKVEITLEANPGTFEKSKFKDFRNAGINRLSVGIQSFDDRKLLALGRVHNAREAKEAAAIAGEIFDNFNLDLMFGLPEQTLEDLQNELSLAFSFRPPHLSLYQLTLEPNTYFAKFPPPGIPDVDVLSDMADFIQERTAVEGFDHYEVSAYAREGKKCRHNLNYWQFGDYLAVGPGAHGKTTSKCGISRFYNYRDPAKWLTENAQKGSKIADRHDITPQDLPFEFMLNALRLREGVPFEYFYERTGLNFSSIEEIWSDLLRKGLVMPATRVIRTTDRGWLFLNEVLEAFL